MTIKNNTISVEPYKGVRDFYPKDLAIQKFIFQATQSVAKSFGYEEYGASILEPTELYKAKSGEEIVNEQTYSFTDRGEREVTLRPEMTPTLARMVARKKRDLSLPLRWYSIQNFFRYERPQKGRLREFWQLNADIFGVEGIEAEVETISLGYQIMKKLGAQDEDYVIKINYAGMLARAIYEAIGEKDEEKINKTIKIIDRLGKIPKEEFNKRLYDVLGLEKANILKEKIQNDVITKIAGKDEGMKICKELKNKLNEIGIMNVEIDTLLTRGFDYYTGIVFEFIPSDNKRSLFGGGRYDDLLNIFGSEKIPAVGFGMGDVTMRDFLESRNLLPEYQSATNLYICTLGSEYLDYANKLATQLREKKLNVAVNYSDKKVGDQIAIADKKAIPYVLCIGENEIQSGKFKLKNLKTGEEKKIEMGEIITAIK